MLPKNDISIPIPYNADESLSATVIGMDEATKLARWAVDCFDHVVLEGDHDTGIYDVWAWSVPSGEIVGSRWTSGEITIQDLAGLTNLNTESTGDVNWGPL